mmetsp:Transcript_43043/g.90404  ORF Transcript_43043/g.90404 Transcript_43043/m.90404 type:complete len:1075 (+) Transcript_43043:115-3339(+)
MNRQESHRIYLQLFAPRSTSSQPRPGSDHVVAGGAAPSSSIPFHRHNSHDIHPPNYPTTTPGAPYQFTSSSDSSHSQSSYSFSSVSVATPPTHHPGTGAATHPHGGTTTTPPHHRYPPPSSSSSSQTNKNPRFIGYPSTVTTSAAVRLTDKARVKDVTALLRGKFGLPPISSSSASDGSKKKKNAPGSSSSSSSHHHNHRRKEESLLSNYYSTQQQQSDKSKANNMARQAGMPMRHSSNNNTLDTPHNESSTEKEEEVDALVIVGTMEGPPRGYLRFEHEDDAGEEHGRLELFRHYLLSRPDQQQHDQHRDREGVLLPTAAERMGRPSQVDQQQQHIPKSQQQQQQNNMAHLPISESTATVKASGAHQSGVKSSSTMLLSPSWGSSSEVVGGTSSIGAALNHHPGQSSGQEGSTDSLSPLGVSSGSGTFVPSSGAIGLDLSSSRTSSVGGGGRGGGASWGTTLRGGGGDTMDISTSRGKMLTTLASELSVSHNKPSSTSNPSTGNPLSRPPQHPSVGQTAQTASTKQRRLPSPRMELDTEPIHIVRTVLPDEHPLQVRDEMMSLLRQLRQRSEEEMGWHLNTTTENNNGDVHAARNNPTQTPPPTFRWHFQPGSPLGGNGGSSSASPKIQSIPAYIDVEGYCTEDDESDDGDHDGDSENSKSEDEDEDEDIAAKSLAGGIHPSKTTNNASSQLIKERQRITMLRNLPDPSFLVSGYLLKQSWRDPNVWKRVYCVLSEDRMWTIGRMKPLKSKDDMLSSIRVGRHRYIKLHRSLLLERGEGGSQSTKQYSSSRCSGYSLTPLGHRLPNTFRMLTSHGRCHTFRAYNAQSFRVWVTSLSEKIAQKHGDGMMDLAHVIAEEETLARSRRIDDIAVSPLEASAGKHSSGTTTAKTTGISQISMDIVRFGIAVAAYRELCRHVNDAIVQYNNQRARAVNVQTRVGSGPNRTRQQQPSSPTTGGQRAKNMEHHGMVLSVWEDARTVASKSAQLLHALATLQHDALTDHPPAMTSEGMGEKTMAPHDGNAMMEELIEAQKGVQAILGRQNGSSDDSASVAFSLPPTQLFDPLLEKLQMTLN